MNTHESFPHANADSASSNQLRSRKLHLREATINPYIAEPLCSSPLVFNPVPSLDDAHSALSEGKKGERAKSNIFRQKGFSQMNARKRICAFLPVFRLEGQVSIHSKICCVCHGNFMPSSFPPGSRRSRCTSVCVCLCACLYSLPPSLSLSLLLRPLSINIYRKRNRYKGVSIRYSLYFISMWVWVCLNVPMLNVFIHIFTQPPIHILKSFRQIHRGNIACAWELILERY